MSKSIALGIDKFIPKGDESALPVEGQDAAPQTPLHKDLFVQIDVGVEIVIGCNLVLDENTAIYVQLDRK